jgi:GNAT superfamily N-acetyltransferase
LSAAVITKPTEQWRTEQRAFAERDLSGVDYVYRWADGIHVNIRLEEHKLRLLMMIGVRVDGRKELIALADGYRESVESWADLLRDCRRRGMAAPVLAVGDGALGFWGAPREVFPDSREQLCWFHRTANVLAALAKSAHPGARKALAEIWNAEDRRHVQDGPSRLCGIGPRSPRGRALGPQGWRWRSSSSSQCKSAGARRTRPNSSRWFGQAESPSMALLLNDWRRAPRDLERVYYPPGTLLLAYCGHHPIGCVGLAPRLPAGAAEIKRLYARPAHRGGIGRILMEHAHQHAARHHFTRLVLDVLPTRTAVISFYRQLGYTDIEPYDTESPMPMIYMQRPVTQK